MEKLIENYLLKIEENEKFEEFKNLLIKKNKQFNLTSILDDESVKIKHFLDSLMGESLIKNGAKVIEVGSGGGFPSVPIKILREDINFTLVETTGKKCVYLNQVKEQLKFENFEIFNERCENLAKKIEFRESFDYAIARAVAPLNTLLEYLLPFVKVGGYVLAYKGESEEEILKAENALKILGGKIERVEKYNLPQNLGYRSIIIIKKVEKTPLKYPRGNGKERSKPL